MSSSIAETPQSGAASKKVLKDRESRAREKAAFSNLRHTIELADTKAFWRMEHVDIAEGAAYLIEKLAGGCTEEMPEREPIVFDEENRAPLKEKLHRNEVGKRRRERESNAVEKLKETLMKHSHIVSGKMDKVDILNAAASFLQSLALVDRAKSRARRGKEGPSSPFSEIGTSSSPSALSSPSSSDSGNSSMSFALSPEQNLVDSVIRNNPFLPFSNPLLYSTSAAGSLSNSSSTVEKKHGFHRPWE